MSGSIDPNVLNSLAHPATVNLLQDYQGAAQTAQGIWANRASQANALRGNLLQQATGPDGTVDPLKYNQLAAQAGPGMALAMPAGLEQSQAVQGKQQEMALKSMTTMAGMLDSLGPAATHQQVVDVLNEGQKAGVIQRQGANAVLVGMPDGDDPQSQATRSHILQTIGDRVRSAAERLQSQYGVPGTQTGPDGSTIGYTVNQRGGAVSSPPQQGAPQGTSPETRAAETNVWHRLPDGTYQQGPEARSARPGASGSGGAGVLPPGTNIGNPGATTFNGLPDPSPLLGGLPSPNGAVPVVPPANPSLSAPPQGQPDMLAAGNKIYADAAAAKPDQQKRLIAGQNALDALKLAGISTGPGSTTLAKIEASSEALGITVPPQGTLSDVDYRQILAKNLLRFAQTNAGNGGQSGTNLGLETQLHSHANVEEMLPNANQHVLVQDVAMLKRDMAMTDTMPRGEAAIEHVKNFPSSTDWRAFALDNMEPKDRAAFFQEMQKEPKDGKLHRSLELAYKGGHIALPGASP